jgi:hypothetical protein
MINQRLRLNLPLPQVNKQTCTKMPRLIHLSETEGEVIDSIPEDYEDAFTLEPFGDLCDMYQKSDKKVN